MLAGFAIALVPLFVRNRIAWGYWSLAGVKATLSSIQNEALVIHGQHPASVGLVPWLRLMAAESSVIWQHIIPGWWDQGLYLWTHPGFGRMDLIQGLNYIGFYQAALTIVMTASIITGAAFAIGRRSRSDLSILSLPVYFTSLVLAFYVANARYRAPFVPALYLLSSLGFSLAVDWCVRQPAVANHRQRPAASGLEVPTCP
jgi:hypothetical protein